MGGWGAACTEHGEWVMCIYLVILCMLCFRCNYISVLPSLLTGWGEWKVGQLTEAADWFTLRWLLSPIFLPLPMQGAL